MPQSLCLPSLRYLQIVDLIYRENVFCFENFETITALSRTVLPQRLNQIRRVRLTSHFPLESVLRGHSGYNGYDGYVSACEILSKLPNLEELIIHLHPGYWMAHICTTQQLLVPFHQIQQPTTFAVYLFKDLMREGDEPYGEDRPFQLFIFNRGDCGERRLRG